MTADFQRRIAEVHPEVSFWELNRRGAMRYKKTKAAGRHERIALLSEVFVDDLASAGVRAGVGLDDFFDASAAAWSAWRFATGQHSTLPDEPQTDSRGLRMEIVY